METMYIYKFVKKMYMVPQIYESYMMTACPVQRV